jgi:hypothetical protein
MPRSHRPRKRYVPARVDIDPVETAIALASRLQPFQRASLRRPLRVALERLRTGAGDWPAWCAMADGMNVAEQLALRGIVSDRMAEISAAQAALHALYLRHGERGGWTLRGTELAALRLGRFFHFAQLSYCSQGELRDAIQAVQRKVGAALAGNASPKALVCVGRLGESDSSPTTTAQP